MEYCAESAKSLEDLLSAKQLQHILDRLAKPGAQLVSYDLKSATQGIAGFLGDHLRLTLHVKEDFVRKIHLFVKTIPMGNQPKAEFITQNQFNKREALMFKLFEEMGGTEDPYPWRPKAYIYTENILVMPDLCAEGYKSFPAKKYLDKNHVMVTVTSIARFHAAFFNYITKNTANGKRSYHFLDDCSHIMTEPIFIDSPWLHTAAKLTSKFLKELSINSKKYPDDLEERLVEFYIKACESLKVYEDTLNVIIHKDLWMNNILFRYNGDLVTNAVIIDYQCTRFAPPAFDVMAFLYLTTSRRFRECYENEVLRHYYSVFFESLDNDSKLRMDSFKYNLDSFLDWCEKARMFGMVEAATIFPYILMDPVKAQKTFDNPETYMEYLVEDRSGPVIEHARENDSYRTKQLELYEELVEKYIL
ncbi:uncharacterized protein LOC125068083 [Vanessa atalanta]|uniref:uncharacterized protein LOC125068083 n=1 Tax=Vanessa atalanta TaxID=42275 RepID=UPI001FCE1BCD|nr:uncharacterized protein LOC125068083 [Vanessa atalanta]